MVMGSDKMEMQWTNGIIIIIDIMMQEQVEGEEQNISNHRVSGTSKKFFDKERYLLIL
jgi:hypothetical protein